MWSQAVRALLATAVTLALLTLGRPAFASSSPYCDDRAATMLAADPVLFGPQSTLDRAPASLCQQVDRPISANLRTAHKIAVSRGGEADQAIVGGQSALGVSSSTRWTPSREDTPASGGIHHRIERPPRG